MSPFKNEDLHGNVPDRSPVALVLIDVINDLDFSGGEKLLETALPAARNLAELKRRAKSENVPVIYVNDNFGKWRSDFHSQLEHVVDDETLGKSIAELLAPDPDDYFVLKAKHSGFYHTQLDLLIAYLWTRTLILTGFTTDICVLFTASDAHMRDLNVIVPKDCVAATDERDHERTLEHMARVLGVRVLNSREINFARLSRREASRENAGRG